MSNLGPRKGKTALIALIALVLLTSAATGASFNTLIDGFEDGDTSEWSTDNNVQGITAVTSTAYEGTYAGEMRRATKITYSARSIPDQPEWVSTRVRIETSNTPGSIRLIQTSSPLSGNEVRVSIENGEFAVQDISSGSHTTLSSYNKNEWYRILILPDYNANTATIRLYNNTGAKIGEVTGEPMDTGTIGGFETQSKNEDWYVDNIGIGEPNYKVSGEVTDEETNDVSQAEITVNNGSAVVATTTADDVGEYSANLPNGTYTVYASKSGYTNESETVTISGNSKTVDFQLRELSTGLNIVTRDYLEHGQTADYRVIYRNDSGRYDVSGQATTTSNDSNVVTVDEAALTQTATNDTSINNITYLEATYTANGDTYTAYQNVTVANKSVENIQILPTGPQFSASLDDTTIQVIIVATLMGVAAATISGAFAGVGAMTLVMALGWLGGRVGDGMVIVSVLIGLFIALNVAANIDYSVRR